MLIFLIVVIVVTFFLWALFHYPKSAHDSQYSKTHNYMDFDSGVDSNKVGDSKYSNASIDSVMKQEFINDLLDGDNN